MLPATTERVSQNTSDEINERIRQQTVANVSAYVYASRDDIARRLAELDEEWDTERCLETMAPSISLAGLLLGLTVDRKWFALPIVVQAFFLMHALQGWCPPLPVLRHLGVRTAAEIDRERYALKALRGDFEGVSQRRPA